MPELFRYAFVVDGSSDELEFFSAELHEQCGRWLADTTAATDRSGVVQFALAERTGFVARLVRHVDSQGQRVPSRISEVIVIHEINAIRVLCSSRQIVLFSDTHDEGLGAELTVARSDQQFFAELGVLSGALPADFVYNGIAVDGLLRAIFDHNRVDPVLVAGSDASTDRETLERLFAEIGTVTSVYPLNADSLQTVNDELGIAFSVAENGYRLFSPPVRAYDQRDAYRHPSIRPTDTGAFFSINTGRLTAANALSVCEPIGEILGAETFEFIEKEFRQQAWSAMRQDNLHALEIVDDNNEAVRERLEEMASAVEFAESYAALMQIDAENEKTHREIVELELSDLSEQLDQAQRANAYFRDRLLALGSFGDYVSEIVDGKWEQEFTTFADLCIEINTIPLLRFTGDLDAARDLDNQPRMKAGIGRAWRSVHALADYARLKNDGSFSGSLFEYLQSDSHSGYKVSTHSVAMGESEGVENNPALFEQRVLPVPEEVSGGGTIYMGAHFKLMTGAGTSPRMHFFDNTGGDGIVYIGYIGRHLDTPQTN